jgi:nucleotide-binding universal stress UspA family protein
MGSSDGSSTNSQRREVAMYEKILVPLDGSRRAEAILPHVQKIARMGQSTVLLMKALQDKMRVGTSPTQTQITSGEEEQRKKSAEVYLENLTEELRRMDIKAESKVVYGSPVETIIKVAEEDKADLIAIASHGRSGLGRVFYGSIAAGVLQAVDRPLLVIRSRNI